MGRGGDTGKEKKCSLWFALIKKIRLKNDPTVALQGYRVFLYERNLSWKKIGGICKMLFHKSS
jgi:hypothetical protein